MFNFKQPPTRRQLLQTAALSLCAVSGVGTALAQAWPSSRPIRIVVGFAPGGTTDGMARVMAQHLGEALGQTLIVANSPGASGNLAASEVIRAAADGHTFLIAPTSFQTVNPLIFRQNFNPATDLTPVAGVGRSQMYLLVKPESPFRTVSELVNYARANPGKLSYASAGAGTPPHLAGELFNRVANISAAHIPYRGAAPALTALMANQVDFLFDPGIAFQHVRAGRVRMLAVVSANRSSFFPNVPTLAELGLRGAELDIWFGMWAPNGTPANIVQRMGLEIGNVLRRPDIRARYEALGAEPVGLDNAQFRTTLNTETAMLSRLIREAQIKAD